MKWHSPCYSSIHTTPYSIISTAKCLLFLNNATSAVDSAVSCIHSQTEWLQISINAQLTVSNFFNFLLIMFINWNPQEDLFWKESVKVYESICQVNLWQPEDSSVRQCRAQCSAQIQTACCKTASNFNSPNPLQTDQRQVSFDGWWQLQSVLNALGSLQS